MRTVRILVVPYDSGARGVRMGAGPERILEAGLLDRLKAMGHTVEVMMVEAESGPIQAENATAFALARDLSRHVRKATKEGVFPLVLAGNCISAVGTVSGLSEPVGIVWLDSHGDLNSPETSGSGFLDGMALSVLAGRCWERLAESVPGFTIVPLSDVVLVGVRDLDASEAELIDGSAIRLLGPEKALEEIGTAVDRLVGRGLQIYLHLDLDVMDPSEGRANHFAADGGLTRVEIRSLLEEVATRSRVGALTLSAYEPDADTDGRALEAALELVSAAIGAVARS